MKIISLENSIIGSDFIGVEHFSVHDSEQMAFTFVKKTKNELSITNTQHVFKQEELSVYCQKNSAVFLTINTNSVLQKIIQHTEFNEIDILRKAFPSINDEDFYYEICKQNDSYIVTSCRKTYLKEILELYENSKINIVGIHLGVCAISELIAFIPSEAICTNNQLLLQTSGQITAINSSDLNATHKNYNINGLEINSNSLLNFAGILSLISHSNKYAGNVVVLNQFLFENFKQKNIFKKGLWFSMSLFLILLLLNFFVFTFYFNKVESSRDALLINDSQKTVIKALEKTVRQKQKKVNEIIASHSSKSTILINDVTRILPHSINLTEINYCPIEKNKENQQIVFQENTVLISGTTSNNLSFSAWIDELSQLKWVKKCTIIDFGNGIFKFRIDCKSDEIK